MDAEIQVDFKAAYQRLRTKHDRLMTRIEDMKEAALNKRSQNLHNPSSREFIEATVEINTINKILKL